MKPRCEECGTDLPANAPQGLCPKCLVRMGLELGAPDAAPQAGPEATGPKPQPVLGQARCFGDYELLEEIARGGMGVVYRARQVSLHRTVALKVLLFGRFASDEFVGRFQAEAEAVAMLQHPNIVAIHEVGVHEGQHYFSMDLVEGQNLAARAHDHPLPPELAANYVKTIAEAVHYAHQRGVLHRDLKPSNVLVDGLGRLRITDFGLAKRFEVREQDASGAEARGAASNTVAPSVPRKDLARDITVTGQMLGSPNYMAPELVQSTRGGISVASDVYSLGAILYHLLTSQPPFQGGTIEETLLQVLNAEPVAPHLLQPGVPRDLEVICLKCLEKSAERRYGSAQALADDLGRLLRKEPIQARPASLPGKVWRWSRREPLVASLSGAALALLLGVLIGAPVAVVQIDRGRRAAEAETVRAQAAERAARDSSYASAMNVSQRDFEEGNAAQAFEALRQYLPRKGETDLRGFEWRYLWTRCRGNYPEWLPVHPQVVGAIQFSPDGELLAVYTWNNTLQVWDRAARRRLFLATDVTGFGGFVADGSAVILSRGDASLQICQARTGVTNRVVPKVGVLLAFAAQPCMAVTLTAEDLLTVWDATTFQVRLALPGFGRRKLEVSWDDPVAISPDGRRLAVIEAGRGALEPDRAVRFWALDSGTELEPLPLNCHVHCLSFSPDSGTFVVGDGEGQVRFLSLSGGRPIQLLKAHDSAVLSLAFAPDGKTLATGSSDRVKVRRWDVAARSEKPSGFAGQLGPAWSLAFSADGARLASGTRDDIVRIWAVGQTEPLETLPERLHSHDYGNFVFSPSGQAMAAGCAGNQVVVWNVATRAVRAVVSNATFVVTFSSDSQRLLVASSDGQPQWWNLLAQTPQPLPAYQGTLADVVSVDLTADHRVAALGLRNGQIQPWDLRSGQPLGPPLQGHRGAVRALAFSPRGDKLASGGFDKTIGLWDWQKGANLRLKPEHKGAVCSVAFSVAGDRLASGCGSGTIKVWDPDQMEGGSLFSIPYHRSTVLTLAFSADGKTLASGSEDRTARLWSLASRQQVASFAHEASVRLVVFSPDGNTLATVTEHGTLRVFCAASLAEADAEWRAFSH